MMKKMKKKESASKKVIFAANTLVGSAGASIVDAFSGVFLDDFSAVLNREASVISSLVSKHLTNGHGATMWFNCLVNADNELVEISNLKAKSIAELELKLDLHNLFWE